MSQRDQIETILRVWIDLTRRIHQAADPTRQPQRFGSRAGPLLISAAVLASTLERRPMTALKLSDYVGMARPTVMRHLLELEQLGAVQRDQRRRYSTTAPEIARMLAGLDLAAITNLMRDAAARLGD